MVGRSLTPDLWGALAWSLGPPASGSWGAAQMEVVVPGRNGAMTDCGVGAGFPHIGEVARGKGSWGQWRQFPPMVSRLAVW